jgi:hypothetical protein
MGRRVAGGRGVWGRRGSLSWSEMPDSLVSATVTIILANGWSCHVFASIRQFTQFVQSDLSEDLDEHTPYFAA